MGRATANSGESNKQGATNMSGDDQQEQQAGQQGQQNWWEHFTLLLPQFGAWLAVILIGALAIGVVILLVSGLYGQSPVVRDLASVDYARGLITFIFAVGTMGIALLLTIGALLGSHPEAVFAKAKEVLTVLIGVFGTILGFYFGTSSDEERRKPIISPPTIQTTADGKTMTIFAYISGGDSPYIYNIDFAGDVIPDIKAKTSVDGWIRESIDTTKLDSSPIGYKITLIDARKRSAEYEAKENERIHEKTSSP
jgi:hypothetical protein